MSNIAQMVNVLQAMILTDHEKIVLTPTYHVFEMLKVHQGATAVPIDLTTATLPEAQQRIPMVSASASRDAAGRLHLSLVNTSPDSPVTVACRLAGAAVATPSGRILTAAAMTAHNTFEAPHTVEPAAFTGASVVDGQLRIALPPLSVVILNL
jgi:alpha-N-arabinofuranosidase